MLAFSDGIYAEVASVFIIDLASRQGKNQPQRLLALRNCADSAFVQAALPHAEGDLQTPRSPRQILEWWGTEYRRAQNPNYWINQTRERLHYYRSMACSRPMVIADIYKLGEAALIKAAGGTIWRIERPGHEERTTHTTSTEHLQIQADLTLHNMGDISHLQHLVLTHWHELQRSGQTASRTHSPLADNYL